MPESEDTVKMLADLARIGKKELFILLVCVVILSVRLEVVLIAFFVSGLLYSLEKNLTSGNKQMGSHTMKT